MEYKIFDEDIRIQIEELCKAYEAELLHCQQLEKPDQDYAMKLLVARMQEVEYYVMEIDAQGVCAINRTETTLYREWQSNRNDPYGILGMLMCLKHGKARIAGGSIS